jgi:hypothetical protein
MEPGKYDKHSGFNLQLLKVLNKRYEASVKIRLVAGRWDLELDTDQDGLVTAFVMGKYGPGGWLSGRYFKHIRLTGQDQTIEKLPWVYCGQVKGKGGENQ